MVVMFSEQCCETKMHTKKRRSREDDEGEEDGFWHLLLHARFYIQSFHTRVLLGDTVRTAHGSDGPLDCGDGPGLGWPWIRMALGYATNIDSRKLVMKHEKQHQLHISHSAFAQRQQLPEKRLPMTSECTKAPESGISGAQIIGPRATHRPFTASRGHDLSRAAAGDEAMLEAMLEAMFAAEPPPARSRCSRRSPPALGHRSWRCAPGKCRWGCEDDGERFAAGRGGTSNTTPPLAIAALDRSCAPPAPALFSGRSSPLGQGRRGVNLRGV